MDVDKILEFELYGKFAHFKKFYSNASSLTYSVPPRTVLMGIVASVLEEKRDSYYNWLSKDNAGFGIQILSESRKGMYNTNYIGKNGTSPTSVEIVMPVNHNVRYMVYFYSTDEEKYELFKKRLIDENWGYGLYFGQRQFRAFAKFHKEYVGAEIVRKNDFDGLVSTCISENNIIDINFEKEKQLLRERMPIDFNGSRESSNKSEIIYEKSGKPISGKFKEVFGISNKNICFLE